MNDDQLDDLKQFVAATVSQSEQRVRDDLGGKIDAGLEAVRGEMRDGFAGVAEAMEQHNQHHEERDAQLEQRHSVIDQRLTKLEQRAA